eukprot:183472-Rhodomonas_salina.1
MSEQSERKNVHPSVMGASTPFSVRCVAPVLNVRDTMYPSSPPLRTTDFEMKEGAFSGSRSVTQENIFLVSNTGTARIEERRPGRRKKSELNTMNPTHPMLMAVSNKVRAKSGFAVFM